MTWTKDDFTITTSKDLIDVPYVHRFLSRSYWAQEIPAEVVARSIEGSLCFSVFQQNNQVGFARVITDGATFAYLADVFIDEAFRGLGLSKWLMETIVAHPSLTGLRRFLLVTRDAHGLYEQFGFTPIAHPENFMSIHRPGLYSAGAGSNS
ncbi:GNAT family N-acetyltransferase [Paracnuella aquatica]|uniref:GNAT family N-acetyltransferase n=1 Tax=Paracnuella aquatica TaxID=2268757 RepID=UPI000DEF069F|nr:GNAT family N-acetyltransferase [Paracnuella aquatica]RPD48163.1 N-acetyltransferase [Paracnuella aquatica]